MSERSPFLYKRQTEADSGEHWLTISDLMAGLMMVFLFISIALMRAAFIERDKIKEVAVTYQETQIALTDALVEEFSGDLEGWQASIDRNTLSFEFKSPEVLFAPNEIALQARFVDILNDFFPRYLSVLKKYEDAIEEVRVEGHTSSEWATATTGDQAYFNNMQLSQGRTRSVLEYVYQIPSVAPRREWIKANVAAVGFSSSRLVRDHVGGEDKVASRRVAFRVITNAETQIRKIVAEE